ncbi:arginase family protein [Paraliomyxa miuraensis]|uniref:arginase family protein n=1 Tax=Paraliomyxa miuraensis TaxID=376150 RepID=UPI0022569686|nr:arginase family protein [Paraliomyxa miuraensis]MCX4247769.1 arginase family protein [Paraliomyxa miuraensis]
MKISPDRTFVTFPRLQRDPQSAGGDLVTICNPYMGLGVALTPGALELLEFFEGGATLADVVEASDLDEERAQHLLEPLTDNYILVPADDLEWLLHGVCAKVQRPVGTYTRVTDLDELPKTPAFAVFGVPLDLGGVYGARFGPEAVRNALPKLSLRSQGDDQSRVLLDFENERCFHELPLVIDLGDVRYHPGESLETIGKRIAFVIRETRARGIVPLMIGGDHAWTHFTLAELARAGEDFGIIHFDAHHDMYPDAHGRLNHANTFLGILESDHLKVLHQIGLRTLQLPDDRSVLHGDPRVQFTSARRARTMSAQDVLASLPRDIPYYVSFDVDCMDVDETGSPVIGGLSYYDGLELFEHIGKTFDIIGADFMEVAGEGRPHNRGAELTGRYLFELIVGKQTSHPLRDYIGRIETKRPF